MELKPKVRTDHLFQLQAALLFVLLLLVVVYAAGIFTLVGGVKLDLGGRAITSLSSQTISFLSRLQAPLAITYFVSARDAMPSHLKGVEASVRELLKAVQAQAPGYIDFRVIYPEAGGRQGVAYASSKKASPFSVRKVRQDEHSEQKIWSSIVLSYGQYPEVLIQGITEADLPHLESLIVQGLKALEQPIRPTFAVAAPGAFNLLSAHLREYGQVIQVSLDHHPRIPPEADVLFWIQPERVTPEHIQELRRFVDSGRTAVLAGSPYFIYYERDSAGGVRYRAYRSSPAWEALLSPLGLHPQPDLLMDRSRGSILWEDEKENVQEVEAPFHLRCMPGFYSLKGFVAPARGALHFIAAGPLQLDPRRVAAAGFQAEIVATTTPDAWVSPLPQEPFDNAALSPQLQVGLQNLMVLLKPRDPWKGQVLVLASSSPFRDGILNQPGYAHGVFLRTLARTFTEPQRLARARIDRRASQAIPPLGPTARVFWRVITIFLVPVGLLALGVRRYLAAGGRWPAFRDAGRVPARVGTALAVVLLGTQIWRGSGRIVLDLTGDAVNAPVPFTRQFFARRSGGLRADLIITPRASLPASMKHLEATLDARLDGLDIEFRTLRPETLSDTDRALLSAHGLRPFEAQTVRNDSVVAQQVWSGLLLSQGERTAVIPRLDLRALDHLDFLLVAAVQRLESGRAPQVAVIAEPPRLSPAEAFNDYTQKGLLPPHGADVFSEAEHLLRDYGYRVFYVNPKEPHLPEGVDLLLWFQPHRDATPLIRLLSQHLSTGGKGMVALQHFNIQQRQYHGAGFHTVYWPQPQAQDLDRYLRLFGVEQAREVLMDRTRSHLSLETQINRQTVREYEDQEVALPFLMRAVGANFSGGSPITQNLGDLLFIWGNRFSLDRSRLSQLNITSQALITTSSQAWSYPWKGGWLPEEIFEPHHFLPGPQPLALLLKGKFPPIEVQKDTSGMTTLSSQALSSAQAEGALLLIGCSEMFKNEYLYAPGFQHDQFLLNSVASLAYDPEMARLQARRQTVRGFAFQGPRSKALWRLFVVSAGPLGILTFGLRRYLKRHKPMKP